MKKYFLIIFLLKLSVTFAQDPIGIKPYEKITLDLATGQFTSYSIPFDVPFIIQGNIPSEITNATLYISEANGDELLQKKVRKFSKCGNFDSTSFKKLQLDSLELATQIIHDQNYQTALNAKIDSLKKPINKDTLTVSKIKSYKSQVDSLDGNLKKLKDSLEKITRSIKCNECQHGISCTSCCKGVQAACWQASLFTSDSALTDCGKKLRTFSFTVDPLPAFKKYRFCIVFKRTVNEEEKIKFTGFLRPLFKNLVIRQFENDLGQTNEWLAVSRNFNGVADTMKDEMISYYSMLKNVPFTDNEKVKLRLQIQNNLQGNASALLIPIMEVKAEKVVVDTLVDSLKSNFKNSHQTIFSVAGKMADKNEQLKLTGALLNFLKSVLGTDHDFQMSLYGMHNGGTFPPPYNPHRGIIKSPVEHKQDFINNYNNLITLASDLYKELDAAKFNNEKIKLYQKAGIDTNQIKSALKDLLEFIAEFNKLKNHAEDYKNSYDALISKLDNMKFDFWPELPVSIDAQGLTSADFVTRGEWYITADLGVSSINLFGPNKKIYNHDILPYVGVNFNFGPLNRQAHYSLINCIFQKPRRFNVNQFLKSMSFVAGITIREISDNERYEDLWDTKSLLTGIGIRITEGLRLTNGIAWLRSVNPNKLITEKPKIQGHYYMSISLDLDLKKWLKDFGNALHPPQN